MANEAVIIELLGNKGDPINYTCVDGDAWLKGAIMKLSDNREVDTSAAAGNVCAGILAAEKVVNDGSTTVSCYTNGIFDLLDAGAGGTVGVNVVLGGINTVRDAAATEAEKGWIMGKRFATDGGGETQEVRVLIGKHH